MLAVNTTKGKEFGLESAAKCRAKHRVIYCTLCLPIVQICCAGSFNVLM